MKPSLGREVRQSLALIAMTALAMLATIALGVLASHVTG